MIGKIGIIDADFWYRTKQRFPNLAAMKLSGYWRNRGYQTQLMRIEQIGLFDGCDRVYCCKVFTDTETPPIPKKVLCGGTGFYFDRAQPLPMEIEHAFPDYDLYTSFVPDDKEHEAYYKTSIGFLTRGCFRKCPFCVNQNYNRVVPASPLNEFLDITRPKITLLDDNFLGYYGWRQLFEELQATQKRFCFKQGLDERLLDDEKCELLFSKFTKWDGDWKFAFDNIEDYDLIRSKLEIIRRHTLTKSIKFYVLVGFRSTDIGDIGAAFRRINLLRRYDCLPYIMRFASPTDKPWKRSPFKHLYSAMARWCNQPNFFRKLSIWEYMEHDAKIRRQSVIPEMRELRVCEAELGPIEKL